MSTIKNCPSCGAPLLADAPQGLCAACLLKTAPASQPPSGETPSTPKSRRTPPSIQEIAPHFPQLEIVEILGHGGMGAVYKARQTHLDRWVALKILLTEGETHPSFNERFKREARTLAKLNHPGIVAIHDFGKVGPFHYLILEFVDGANLHQMIQDGHLNASHALGLVMQICEALQFAHDVGVVHRDIKPSNILVDRSGRVKIADFGLAKLLDPAPNDLTLTADHHVMGTVHYMAPEQMTDPLSVDHRADIYSLGVVFYEMLTGTLPMGKFQPPSQKVQVDIRLDEVVLRTLEQAPSRRYQQARDVSSDVASIQPETPSAVPPGAPLPPRSEPVLTKAWNDWWAHRHGFVANLVKISLAAIYLLGLVAFFSYQTLSIAGGIRRQFGYPSPWIVWEYRFLDTKPGGSLDLSFPGWTWAALAASLASFYILRRIRMAERPLRWFDTQIHYAVWTCLLATALTVTALPHIRKPTTGTLLETPSKLGHFSSGTRWSNYALETPANHRVSFWIEWLRDGKPVEMPGLDIRDFVNPARGKGFKGYADFILQMEGVKPKHGTNQVAWQWTLRGADVNTAYHGTASNPFLGLPQTDSSYGHEPSRSFKPGETLTVLVVRGDRERLEGKPWDPAMTGRANLEMRLKARLDPLPETELREFPTSRSTLESSTANPPRVP